jgi:hypothetical protein
MYRFGELARPPAPATTLLRLSSTTVMVGYPSIKIYNRSNDEAGGEAGRAKAGVRRVKKVVGYYMARRCPLEFAFRFS